MTKEHRELGDTVSILKSHIEYKIGELPRLAKEFKLNEATVEGLREHLRSELDYLNDLPSETSLEQILQNHFDQGAITRERITGKSDAERHP